MTEAERKAMEWLENATTTEGRGTKAFCSADVARTLKAMLARPVLPDEPSEETLDAMRRAFNKTHMKAPFIQAVYRALYAHLTAPKTEAATLPERYEQERKAVHWFIDRMQELGLDTDEDFTVLRNVLQERLRLTAPKTKEVEIKLWAKVDERGKVIACGPLGGSCGSTFSPGKGREEPLADHVVITGKATVPA